MAQIRDIGLIAEKWTRVTPQRAADYESGVKAPRVAWNVAAKAANQSWKDGITAAVTADRFNKGVTRAGEAAWVEGVALKGLARWGPGVQVSGGKYSAGFAPYRDAISRVVLPPRFARRDPRNQLRVAAIVDALSKLKASL